MFGGVLGVGGDFLEGVRLETMPFSWRSLSNRSRRAPINAFGVAFLNFILDRRRPVALWRGVPAECQAVSRKASPLG
jgi:hypothetical protein